MAVDINGLWDFGNPALSEQRFRDALATATGDDALLLQTQIARTYGLRKDFAGAQKVLAAVEPTIAQGSAEVRVRYLLELGRTHASAAHSPEQRSAENDSKARSANLAAFELAKSARLDGLAIDALHMMAFVDTDPQAQLEWDLKALAYMEQSTQDAARRWEGSLRNNVGYAQHQLGNHDAALGQFRLSRAAFERAGNAGSVRVADWMIAWTLRAQGHFREAIDIQLRLEREWAQTGAPDPYVFEELEHLYRAVGDAAQVDAYADKLRKARAG